MDSLKRSMRWDEQAFGREYDLDMFMIVAVSHFNMGAMENKGLNVFNDKYVLASPDTATDQDFVNIEAIIAHEYFHNWTGNRITCRDWFQLCLKEGLTVFRDQEFTSDMRSRVVARIGDVRGLRTVQFTEDAGPLAHPVRPELYREINNFYTSTVYDKGAEVVRMIKTLIGPQLFRKGMDLYFERHDGEAATIEQFVQCFADASGRDFTQFMRWYSQAGTPEITATGRYDAAAKTYRLDLAQTHAADARPAGQRADGGAARRRPGRQERRPAAQARRRARPSAACWCSTSRRRASLSRTLPSRRCFRSTAASRRRSSSTPSSRPTICACSRRATATRSTAGRRCRRSPPACSPATWRGCAPDRIPEADEGLLGGARRDPRRSGAGARLHRRGAAICRARPTSPARSAGMSIPTPSSAPAPACARWSACISTPN